MLNWYMKIDVIFRTNNLKLLLIFIVGIIFTEKFFLGYLNFNKFDNKDTYDFIFDFINARMFGDIVPLSRVIVAD